jgi:hypothetical protein
MSGKRVVMVAYQVPLEKQNEVLTCLKYFLEGKIGYAIPIAFSAGRPRRAFYAFWLQLTKKEYVFPEDLILCFTKAGIDAAKIATPFDFQKEMQEEGIDLILLNDFLDLWKEKTGEKNEEEN